MVHPMEEHQCNHGGVLSAVCLCSGESNCYIQRGHYHTLSLSHILGPVGQIVFTQNIYIHVPVDVKTIGYRHYHVLNSYSEYYLETYMFVFSAK